MNYSDEYKTILLLPMRQGTRAVFQLFKCLGFVSNTLRPESATHALHIPEEKSYYDIIITKRHPYNRYLSLIKWSSTIHKIEYQSHDEILKSVLSIMDDYNIILNFYKKYHIKYFIDTENIVKDILDIPLIKNNLNNPCLQSELKNNIHNNPFKENERFLTQNPLPDYIKEKIYNRYQEYFETFNYQK